MNKYIKIPSSRFELSLITGLVAMSFTALFISAVFAAPSLPAKLKVIDGDTVEIGNITYDLYGIEVPELGQICLNGSTPWHCGLDAAYALIKRFAFDPPTCRKVEGAKTGAGERRQVICNTGGLSAAAVLLEDGYAMVTAAAPGDYQRAERAAKRATLGVWRGRYIHPRQWRAGVRLAEEAGHAPDCPVKAITSGKAGKIYYVPFDAEFPAIKVRPSRGDQCFGSDETARKAGFRRPAPKP